MKAAASKQNEDGLQYTPPHRGSELRLGKPANRDKIIGSNPAIESLLPQCLKQNQGHAIRQVQRPGIVVEHRNPQPAFVVSFQQLPRQPGDD
jgi:hypothetical protein